MATATTAPTSLDEMLRGYYGVHDAIAGLVRETRGDRGFLKPNGQTDKGAVLNAAYARVEQLDPAEVAEDKLDPAKSLAREEAFVAVYPNAPGANVDLGSLNVVELGAFKVLDKEVWGLFQDGPGGAIQKRLGAEGSTLILCRTTVMRKPLQSMGVIVTNNEDLILNDSVRKQADKMLRVGENVREHVRMVEDRHPELAGPIKARLTETIGEVALKLGTGK